MLAQQQTDDLVRRVCRDHLEAAPEIIAIYSFPIPGDPGHVRLLEVDDAAGPRTSEVTPFTFAGGDSYPPVTVAVVLPDEFERIQTGQMALPPDWGTLANGQPVDLGPLRVAA